MKIKQDIRDRIIAHAQKLAPVECCGYLAQADGVICRHYELTNIDNSPEHFSFDPKEQFTAIKNARGQGLEVGAVYHSHPATPARPSAEDIRLAYDPQISYVIISLADGKEDIKSFKIKDGQVTLEEVEIVA